uniref:Uncharacterized protein n=1 Tax=Siphoviridae sp. ctGyV19 TaxID=2826225 RepID=A0A8S5MW70_9CAUD|nr:MAG TPA: hypothetical protein [Siphoviridae sp. ctGyV19]
MAKKEVGEGGGYSISYFMYCDFFGFNWKHCGCNT